ncbi:MAG: RidA family protein [Cyanobacteria bacterium P01_A01_bin.114]
MISFSRRQIVAGAIAAAGFTAAHKATGADSATGVDRTMQLERKNYPHLDAPVGPYVHAVSYNGMLFLSGLTAFNTPAQGQDLPTQAEAVFSQLGSILEAEGKGFENLIKVTIFVTEFGEIDAFREVLFNTYQDNLPASALIQVRQLFAPDLNIEVEAIVALT